MGMSKIVFCNVQETFLCNFADGLITTEAVPLMLILSMLNQCHMIFVIGQETIQILRFLCSFNDKTDTITGNYIKTPLHSILFIIIFFSINLV